jgi:hypothetical protein
MTHSSHRPQQGNQGLGQLQFQQCPSPPSLHLYSAAPREESTEGVVQQQPAVSLRVGLSRVKGQSHAVPATGYLSQMYG